MAIDICRRRNINGVTNNTITKMKNQLICFSFLKFISPRIIYLQPSRLAATQRISQVRELRKMKKSQET